MAREYRESNFEIVEQCKKARIWKGFVADQQWWIVAFGLPDFPTEKDFSMRNLRILKSGLYDLRETAWAFTDEKGARDFYDLHN